MTPLNDADAWRPSSVSLSGTSIDASESFLLPGGSGDPFNDVDTLMDCDGSDPSELSTDNTWIPQITNTSSFVQLGSLSSNWTSTTNNSITPAISFNLTHTNLPGNFSSFFGNGTGLNNSSSLSPSISLQFTNGELIELQEILRLLFNIGNGTNTSSVNNNNNNNDTGVLFSSLLHSINNATNTNTTTNTTTTTTPPPKQTFSPGSILGRFRRAAPSNTNNAMSKRLQSESPSKRAEGLSGRARFKSRRAEEFGPVHELREVKSGYAAAKLSRRRLRSKPLNAKR
jgi:hypothetical protein